MAEMDAGGTAGGHLVEAAKEGGRAAAQVAGKVAGIVSSAVRGVGGDGAAPGAASVAARAATDAAGEAQREVARRSAEGMVELGRLCAGLLEEQVQHNQRLAAALGRAVNVDWDQAARVQSEFLRASLERVARLNDRYLEIARGVMTAASAGRQ